MNNFGEKEAWAYLGTVHFPGTPYYLDQERGKLDFKFSQYIHFRGSIPRPVEKFGKRERGRIQGLPNFLVPPIISGTGKATDFNFCMHIM